MPVFPPLPRLQATVLPASASPSGFRVIAIIAAYNEEDILSHVIRDLIENGVLVYLIDNSSTDRTIEEARPYLGKGLLHIERFPQDCGYPKRNEQEYVWRDLLRRKEELADRLRANWYIHADADEFRESPWPGKTLSEAIHFVDTLGYNALQFELLNFRPTDNAFVPGTDVRDSLQYYEPGELFNTTQVKAWKHTGQTIQLAQNGGHAVAFPNRRIFPVPFLVRHYPIRGETHGQRKVFKERVPRFAKEERAIQWHVQYDGFVEGETQFLHDPAILTRYDPMEVRTRLLTRVTQDMLLMDLLRGTNSAVSGNTLDGNTVCAWIGRLLNAKTPVELSAVVRANELLDRYLQTPLTKPDMVLATVRGDQVPLVLAMTQIKSAQATMQGNNLTARRLAVLRHTLLKTRQP